MGVSALNNINLSGLKKKSNITELIFSIGGFFSGTISVELEGNSIITKYNNCEPYHEDECCTPTEEDWTVFSNSLISLGVWKWKRKYDDQDVMDGTQWELTLCEVSRKKRCFGSNDYPTGFNEFVLLVNQLVNSDVFQGL